MADDAGRPKPNDPTSTSGFDSSNEFDPTIVTGDRQSASGAPPSPGSASGASVGTSGPIPSAPTGVLPKSIGRYRILGKLGEGGMGIVYEAEQQDPRRRVALKVVRGGHFVDENTIRMFRREAETLARLRHPNIGAIYESGNTPDGQHFFAMELVVGDNLSVFLGKRPKTLTTDEVQFRLTLFMRIAEAVNYAHQRGVIHRDLKPTNIIVSGETHSDSSVTSLSGVRTPEVKILDFGLARITEGDVQASQVTEVGVIKGTLPYMAPEQARGNAEAIDVRTDVYALGVILYEMLSSTKPYDVGRASLIEAVRVICEEPPRSLRTTISGSRRIDPDIETIVGKALEKDADRRYASAAAMAEDVGRYLSSQPIMARPPSTLYHIRKFADRNRALVAGIVMTFVVLVAGIVVSSWQALRATRAEQLATARMAAAQSAEARALAERRDATVARTVAEQQRFEAEAQKAVAATERQAAVVSGEHAHLEAAKAGAINRFLQDMLATADPWAGDAGKVTLDAALEGARTRIGSWAATDPEVDIAIRGTIASAFGGVGRYAEAESLLRGGFDRLAGEKRPNPALSATLHRQIGGLLMQTARYSRAEQEFRQAGADQARARGPVSDTTALIVSQIAASLAYQGRYAAADSSARAAMNMVRTSHAWNGQAAPSVLRTQAYIVANWREDYTSADSLLRLSVKTLAARGDGRSVESSEALEELAGNRVLMGDMKGADSLYREAVAVRRRVLGDNHPLVVRALEHQSDFLYKSGKLDQTLQVLQQVLAIRQRGLGPESAPVGRTWASLGPVYARANRLPEAEAAFTTGIGILRQRLGDRSPDLATALRDYADLKVQQRKFEQAERFSREALAIRLDRLGAGSPGTVAAQVGLAEILRARRAHWRFPAAESLLIAARTSAVSMRGAKDAGALRAGNGLVQLYEAWGKHDEAEKWRSSLPASQRETVQTPTR